MNVSVSKLIEVSWRISPGGDEAMHELTSDDK